MKWRGTGPGKVSNSWREQARQKAIGILHAGLPFGLCACSPYVILRNPEGGHESQGSAWTILSKESSGLALQLGDFQAVTALPILFQPDRQGMLRLFGLQNKKTKASLLSLAPSPESVPGVSKPTVASSTV